MPVVSTSVGSVNVNLSASSSPTIYNVAANLVNTEYSQALSSNTLRFTIRSRGKSKIQLAFTSGQTNSNYITIPRGTSFTEQDLNLSGVTLYFEVDHSDTIEILEWT